MININGWCGFPPTAAHQGRVSPACKRGVCCLLQACTRSLAVMSSWPHLSLPSAARRPRCRGEGQETSQNPTDSSTHQTTFQMHLLFNSCTVTSVLGVQKYQTGEFLYFLQTNAFGHTVPAFKKKKKKIASKYLIRKRNRLQTRRSIRVKAYTPSQGHNIYISSKM